MVVVRIDRLARSLSHLLEVIEGLEAVGTMAHLSLLSAWRIDGVSSYRIDMRWLYEPALHQVCDRQWPVQVVALCPVAAQLMQQVEFFRCFYAFTHHAKIKVVGHQYHGMQKPEALGGQPNA